MKKFFLVVFILLDIAVIAASVMFLMARLKDNSRLTPAPSPIKTPVTASTSTVTALPASSTGSVKANALPGTAAVPIGGTRKILFTYRNSKARKVMIRAEFIGWRAEPLQKEPNHCEFHIRPSRTSLNSFHYAYP